MTTATFTVYDTEDSSWFRSGLTITDAHALCDERNRENSRRGNRYEVVSDADFIKMQNAFE